MNNPITQITENLTRQNLWEDHKVLERNEYLQVMGNINTNLYFIVSGSLRIFGIDENEEHTIRFGYMDNLIAALDSFITGEPSSFYIQALKRTELKSISKETYQSYLHSSAENYRLWMQALEGLIYQQMEREMDILCSSPLERYKRVLKRSPQLFQEIPHKYIANYLRMTPETLSRIKKS